jgi:hypothetical protein
LTAPILSLGQIAKGFFAGYLAVARGRAIGLLLMFKRGDMFVHGEVLIRLERLAIAVFVALRAKLFGDGCSCQLKNLLGRPRL